TSESHSQANHSAPPRVYEKVSTVGTAPAARIASPFRTCHPVSLSRNKEVRPPERNSTCTSVTTKTTPLRLGRTIEANDGTRTSLLERAAEWRTSIAAILVMDTFWRGDGSR